MRPLPHPRNPQQPLSSSLRRETGSVLLVLLFLLAAMVIAMAAAAPRIAQQIKRDRETEMIHRGEQYARAIKRYYKKTGRYPTRIEELENTNNIRFLRKKYQDPMSADGKWRLVRYGEMQLGQGGTGGGAVGGLTGGTNPPGGPPSGGTAASGDTTGDSGSSSNSGFSSSSKSSSGFGSNFGGGSGSLFGSGSGSGAAGTTGGTGTSGTSMFGSSSGGAGMTGSGQTFGGGPIVGVASTSEKQGIHEFNNKKQYNQWLFVYDPTQDPQGTRLIKGPYNPKAFVGTAQNPLGQPVSPGGFGGSSGFGQATSQQPPPQNPMTPTAPNR